MKGSGLISSNRPFQFQFCNPGKLALSLCALAVAGAFSLVVHGSEPAAQPLTVASPNGALVVTIGTGGQLTWAVTSARAARSCARRASR